MQTQVEGMMIAQAEESMAKFLGWAKKQCAEAQQVCLLFFSADSSCLVIVQLAHSLSGKLL